MDCVSCGFAHLYPVPSQERIEEFYRHAFYQKRKTGYIAKTKKELGYWEITYGDRMEVFNKYIRRKRRRILDVGCSGGFFLEYFRKRGWEGVGVEPAPDAARYARMRGIDVIEKPFETITPGELGMFDAINMSFVLEHLRDPADACAKCFDMLNRQGVMVVEVPNDFNILQQTVKKLLKKSSYWISFFDHVNYFTHKSLERLVERAGFTIVLKEGSYPMELFLLMGEDYVGNDAIGRRCHEKRMKLETGLNQAGVNYLKRGLYRGLYQLGVGRESICYCTKPG